jgi:hypothetical protein
VISANIRFEGFDARSWTNLISLFAPNVISRLETDVAGDAAEVDEAAETKSGALIIVLDDRDRVLTAFHTVRGRVVGLEWKGPSELPALCERWGAARAFALREGVMEEIAERVGRRANRGDDYLAQWLLVSRTIREMSEAGLMHSWPRPLANVPIPTIGMVRRALDSILPDDHAMVAVIFKGPTPWTAMALRRRAGEIDMVAGPDLIARWTGPLGGDWRRDYRVITDAVARAVAPVHMGLFMELDTMRELLRSPDAGTWATRVAVRDMIIHPTPPYVAVALGADAVRGVAQKSATFLGGIDALAPLAPLATYLRGRVAEVASVTATLGFDPLKLLATWLRRAEQNEQSESS